MRTSLSVKVLGVVALGAGLCWATVAHAQVQSVFAITLGSEINRYADCESEAGRAKICRHTPVQKVGGIDYYIELRPQRPRYLKTNLMVQVKEGRIHSLVVETNGLPFQDQILKDFTTLYGPPASITRPLKQNSLGAQFEIIEASWQIGTGESKGLLQFIGADTQVDSGSISFSR